MKLGNIQIKKGSGGGGGGVTTFNSRSGAVTLQDTDISGAGGLLADGTVAGATSQAQDFGANGIKANAIATSTGTVLTIGNNTTITVQDNVDIILNSGSGTVFTVAGSLQIDGETGSNAPLIDAAFFAGGGTLRFVKGLLVEVG